jgi:hypothetical protein
MGLVHSPATMTTTHPLALQISQVLTDYLNACAELKAWEAHKKAITTKMMELHQQGALATKVEHNGFTIALQDGRTTIELDKMGKAQVDLLKQQMVEEGHGETKVGAPFWVAREVKAKA